MSDPGPPAAPVVASAAPTPPAVETARLTRRFGSLTAVDDLSLLIPAGAIFGLLGPNGAGKSTTLKMLTTLLKPSSGSAHVCGFDVARQSMEVRRRIGYVPQLLSADGSLTGYENLLIFAKLYGIARGERARRIQEALDFMGLADAAPTLVRHYSGGMIRRLEVAQSMLHRPAVLFLDEPTVGLDPVARQAVWTHLRELRRQFGTTILMTTHDMEEADLLCETVAIMHRGRVVALGSPTELKAALAAGATLDDVFVHYAGTVFEAGGRYRDVAQGRRTARRLG
jgi:ABC-2 type transport system ATP-binding protein